MFPPHAESYISDVSEYLDFLDTWFTKERWLDTQRSWPGRSGMPTSEEIAYALLRFGDFNAGDWSEWRGKGFVALVKSIRAAIAHTRSMTADDLPGHSRSTEPLGSSEHADRLQSMIAGLRSASAADGLQFAKYPLLCAIVIHVLNIKAAVDSTTTNRAVQSEAPFRP